MGRVGNDRSHHLAQPREVRFKRLGECIELVRSAQVRRQDAGRDVLDAERDDGDFAFGRVLDFAEHAIRLVGRGRQDEHNGAAVFDGLAARLVPTPSGDDIARRNPAPQSVGFERVAGRLGDRLVDVRETDEDFGRRGNRRRWLNPAAFGRATGASAVANSPAVLKRRVGSFAMQRVAISRAATERPGARFSGARTFRRRPWHCSVRCPSLNGGRPASAVVQDRANRVDVGRRTDQVRIP